MEDQNEVLEPTEVSAEDKSKMRNKIVFTQDERSLQFYDKLRKRLKGLTPQKANAKGGKLAEFVLLLPDFVVLVMRLALDPRVPNKKKVFIGAIITYLILPIDIIPDFIPVIGYMDDLVLVVLALRHILNDIDQQIVLDNWSGEDDLLVLLQKIASTAEQLLDKNVLSKINKWLNRHEK